MQIQQSLKLYTYFRSSTAWRVRIGMNLKKINYQAVFVNLLKGEQKISEYEKINPNNAVPALEVDGQILVESMAILQYLEEVYPDVQLIPKDPFKKAQIIGFCEIINSGMHPYQNLRLFGWVEGLAPGFDRISFVQEMLQKGFHALEKLLEQSHGKYCFGDEITLADLFLVPQVGGAIARFKFQIDKFPIINQIYENLKNIPEFVSAAPENQADFK